MIYRYQNVYEHLYDEFKNMYELQLPFCDLYVQNSENDYTYYKIENHDEYFIAKISSELPLS
jgi:hypothetical protein